MTNALVPWVVGFVLAVFTNTRSFENKKDNVSLERVGEVARIIKKLACILYSKNDIMQIESLEKKR